MADSLDIQINAAYADAMLAGLTEEAVMRAWRRTLRKTAAWLKRKTINAVSAETAIAAKVLRARMRYFARGADEGKMWAGLNPLGAARLGDISQSAAGVTVASFTFPRAWTKKSQPQGPVYRRVGTARFPIVRMEVEWSGQAQAAFEATAPEAEARILEILEQEIAHEMGLK